MPYPNEHAARLKDPDKLKECEGFSHASRTHGIGKGLFRAVSEKDLSIVLDLVSKSIKV